MWPIPGSLGEKPQQRVVEELSPARAPCDTTPVSLEEPAHHQLDPAARHTGRSESACAVSCKL